MHLLKKPAANVLLSVFFILSTHASFAIAGDRYKKSDISDARFGTGERARLLQVAYGIANKLNKKIIGQEEAVQSLQQRLIQYLEGFPHRTREPIALNMIGLPGVGKSAMIDVLSESGFKVVHFDAQKYVNSEVNVSNEIGSALVKYIQKEQPVILAIEELDKIKEVVNTEFGEEKTSALIGTLNQILSDGMISYYGEKVKVSNVFVLTTMNFAPDQITEFTNDVLSEQKSFYDLTVDELNSFIKWVRTSPGARYKILSRLFRNNTVGRIAPNMVIMEPISKESYRKIAVLKVDETISKSTRGKNSSKKVQVGYDSSFIDFLVENAVYAPSGARETIFLTDALTEQLINFGIKTGGNQKYVDVPRKIQLSYDFKKQVAVVTVTPLLLRGKQLNPAPSFTMQSRFSSDTRMFEEPSSLLTTKPKYPKKESIASTRITKKMTREIRFPKSRDLAKGLDDAINERLTGQQNMAKILKEDFNRYLSRPGPSKKEPSFRVLSGFPGVGKSEMAKIVAEYLHLPLIRVNMQQFSSDSPNTVMGFFETLSDLFSQNEINIRNPEKPFILLIEELDKVFEIDPGGKLVNRPIMGVIKDLLNDGKASFSSPRSGSVYSVDIRGGFTLATMNFSVDRFGFEADPRLTTIEDVMEAWKKLSSTPMAVKGLLGGMFLPETVSRIMSRFSIVKPLSRVEYTQLVKKQIDQVVSQRLQDKEGRNVAQIQIEASPRYLEYLFNETVIPSEGARNTVVSAGSLIGTDLEDVLASLPRSSKYASSPLIVTLDYWPSKTKVVGKVRLANEPARNRVNIIEKLVPLQFPPMGARGKMTEERLLVSAHEFGHALISSRLGLRFDDIVVVSPKPGVGGYVKNAGGRFNARELMGAVYSLLGARAMERLVLNKDPLAKDSVLNVTAGASSDIVQATKILYRMIFAFGFDPNGGILDGNYAEGPGQYANIAGQSPEMGLKLGLILREIEDRLVEDLVNTHSKDWYVQKVIRLARKGGMKEKEFYHLINYVYPGEHGDKKLNYGNNTELRKLFKKYITSQPGQKARRQRRGQDKETVQETTDKYLGWFAEALKKHLHGEERPRAEKPCSDLLK